MRSYKAKVAIQNNHFDQGIQGDDFVHLLESDDQILLGRISSKRNWSHFKTK